MYASHGLCLKQQDFEVFKAVDMYELGVFKNDWLRVDQAWNETICQNMFLITKLKTKTIKQILKMFFLHWNKILSIIIDLYR